MSNISMGHMKLFIKVYERKTNKILDISDSDKYRLNVNNQGELYVTSLMEKDEDGYDKELDVTFEVLIK